MMSLTFCVCAFSKSLTNLRVIEISEIVALVLLKIGVKLQVLRPEPGRKLSSLKFLGSAREIPCNFSEIGMGVGAAF